ncbi:MAG TPA: DNA-formamidopyrimidine glycosylase family protein [Solirubrobacterales bacterium]|nr:DNA-formamidopyrimidine glycosylase family protein [Solirubrobacterales bacterium]
MPEGDTIHRAARRINLALAGREIDLAEAPNPRSPVHHRAGELHGRTLERAEAFGKHLLVEFSGGVVVHSHLGMNGRWRVSVEGDLITRGAWLAFGAAERAAAQTGGKLLRIVSLSRARNDPALAQLGPDPLRAGFDPEAAAERLRRMGAGREAGDALLDQSIVAGVGNALKSEAFFCARIDPTRSVDSLGDEEAKLLLGETQRIMRISVNRGRRPHWVYRQERRHCPRCGERIEMRRQGDANRSTYWCPTCQG